MGKSEKHCAKGLTKEEEAQLQQLGEAFNGGGLRVLGVIR